MKKQQKNKIALLLTLVLIMSSICGMTSFAAEDFTESEELIISNFTVEPSNGVLRMAKGYNYNFNVADASGNVYGTVSGTVIFDYKNGAATVQSAGTPKVTVTDSTSKITADAVGSTDGTTAVVTITVKLTKYLVLSNTMTAKIKCNGSGQIWVE